MNWDVLVVIGLFVGVLTAAGGGLAYALRLRSMGFAAVLGLGLWLVFSLAYAMPFGWSARVGDTALALLIFVLVAIATRNRERPVPAIPYQRFDAWMLVVVLMGLSLPAVVLPVPLDTDAQGFGYLALMAREAGNLTTLAPFQPQINYLYAPGFTVTAAYFSEHLGLPMHTVQFGLGAGLAWLFVWVMYDFGVMLGGRVRGRAHVMAAFIGTGLVTSYMDSHYTSLYGLAFGAVLLAAVYRIIVPYADETVAPPLWSRFGGGVLALAALVLVHPDTTIIIGLGLGAWLLLAPLAAPRPTLRRWLLVTFGLPTAALVPLLPWLWGVRHLLGGDITSPFERDPAYWRVALGIPPEVLYHGGVGVLIALVGLVIGLRYRQHIALLSLGWLVLVVEFAAFGLLEEIVPGLVAPITRYDYPFSIAWKGPVIPYILLTGVALAALWNVIYNRVSYYDPDATGPQPVSPALLLGYSVLLLAATAVILGGAYNRDILALSKGRVTFFGAFASHADVSAMAWLRENTAADAYVLNFPGPQEGDWVPVISERRSVYYRPQPFFDRPTGSDPLLDTPEQVALSAVWDNPVTVEAELLLFRYGVDYVIVPQVVGDPVTILEMYRWRPSFADDFRPETRMIDAPYLTPVFINDGAAVYRVERKLAKTR